MEKINLDLSNPTRETGELRAAKAIWWCSEQLRSQGQLYALQEKLILLLISNATHIIDRQNGKTNDTFPASIQDATNFANNENLHNFLLAEQIWLENNPDEVLNYGVSLLSSRLNIKESHSSEGLRQIYYQIIKALKIDEKQNLSVLDPACGFGIMLAGLTTLLPKTNLRIAGQEINRNLVEYANQLFRLIDKKIDIRIDDLLKNDAFVEEKFDLVLLDPPLELNWNSTRVSAGDSRFGFGLPSNNDSNLLFIQAGLSKLKTPAEGGGVLIALTTNKNLIGEGGNKSILEGFADKDLIKAVVSLPGRLGKDNTYIPTYLLVMSNLKSTHWQNKIQFIDVKSNFEDIYGANGINRLLTREALSQIDLALAKPKPLKLARTVLNDDLMLNKIEISYPNVKNNVWHKSGSEKIAKFTLNLPISKLLVKGSENVERQSDIAAAEFKHLSSYLSFEVEPRFNTNSSKEKMLVSNDENLVALIKLSKEVATFSKKNIGDFDSSKSAYLAVPREYSEKCLQVHPGDIPENVHKYIFLSLTQEERIPYLVAWLNSGLGKVAMLETWERLKDESRFMVGMLNPSEILQFCAFLQVPYLDSNKIPQITSSIVQVEQSINILRNLRDELWVEPNAVESIAELSKSINGEVSLSQWVNELPFPLAASLRTYESFSLDPTKASDQLIHFWEATATFMATYLLSSLRKSDDLWKSEIPKLNSAIEGGRCSLDRATIATWRITLEYLIKRFNRWLISDDVDEQRRAIQLLGGGSRRIYEKLLNPQVINLLTQVNEFRNKNDGHSGTLTKNQEQSKHSELLAITNELRNVIGNAWNGLRLIRPIVQFNLRDGIELESEILMGPTTPFVNKRILVQDNLVMNELYLVGENGYVPLLPFVRMGPQPNEIEDTCYFYSSKEPNGLRFISYHKTMQNEFYETSVDLINTLDEMQNLQLSPFETMFSNED